MYALNHSAPSKSCEIIDWELIPSVTNVTINDSLVLEGPREGAEPVCKGEASPFAQVLLDGL